MRLVFFFITTLTAFLSNAIALESLMFTSDEVMALKEQRRVEKLNSNRQEECLICNGILFVNDGNWTLWLNNKPYSQRLKRPDIQVHNINSQVVELTWRYKDQEHHMSLKPNQGYNAVTRKMID